mgnify:CR=1 FL=1
MRPVAIVGAGSTQFGRAQWSLLKMMSEASHDALTDAGVGDRKVDAVYVANMGGVRNNRMAGVASALVDRLNLYPAAAVRSPLCQLGHLSSPSPAASAAQFRQAVRRFQRAVGLDDDGVVGPMTTLALARTTGSPGIVEDPGTRPCTSAPARPSTPEAS